MQTPISKIVRFPVACLAVMATAHLASAQNPPRLGLRFSAGQPTLTITGTVGTVYSIQDANTLTPTNHWTDRTLVQVQGASTSWTDPATPAPIRRFYRAVSVPAPADTNLVFIQPGTFTMGSPTDEASRSVDETQHTVTISGGFWTGKYLVTQGDYLAVVGSNPSSFTGDPTLPVETVSWYDATNYCALRTQQERAAGQIATNYMYRLPTESEWEYADRAGTTNAFYLGCDLSSGQANFNGQYVYDCSAGDIYNPSGVHLNMTTPVGSFDANPWGLYDMIGNVWEWCHDGYDAYPSGPVTDPQGSDSSTFRVIRGGFSNGNGDSCRSALRNYDYPASANSTTGFRVVLAPAQP